MVKKLLYPGLIVFFVLAAGYGMMTETWIVASLALIGVVATLYYGPNLNRD